MIDKSPEAIERRLRAYTSADAVLALEGMTPCSSSLDLSERVIRGEITHRDAIEIIKERYTRKEPPSET